MIRLALGVVLGVVLMVAAAVNIVRTTSLDAVEAPGFIEVRLMGWLRGYATPPEVAARTNPVAESRERMREARAHYADHCATCHGADGSGETPIGRGLSPRPPDLRAAPTQRQSDGALFHAIERGVRFTGMPAFTTATPDGEAASWALVRLIRTMPRWSPSDVQDVRSQMPRPPAEIRRELDDERFLEGGQP